MCKMKIVHFEGTDSGSPDSVAWHAWRAQGIGASDALAIAAEAGLVGRSDLPSWVKKASILLEEKRGTLAADTSTNWAIERGKAGESRVRRAYEEQTGNFVTPLFGESEQLPFMRCSLDGISLDALIVVEIKCPGREAHELAAQGTVPTYYLPQLAHQAMVVWGVDPGKWPAEAQMHYVSGIPETGDIHIVVVPAHQLAALASDLRFAEEAFWMKVQKGEGGLYGSEFSVLAEAFLEADVALKAAEAVADRAKQALRDYLTASGKERIESDGLAVAFEERVGPIDYTALLKELDVPTAAIEGYRKPGTKSFAVRPHKGKAAEAVKAPSTARKPKAKKVEGERQGTYAVLV